MSYVRICVLFVITTEAAAETVRGILWHQVSSVGNVRVFFLSAAH